MTPLDDERTLRTGDPSGMLEAVASLPRQCAEGYGLAMSAPDLPAGQGVENVAVCGMGGSAVAGDVLRILAATRLGVPVQVVRSPELPEWCQPHTLVVISSYSGDTAETVSCLEEAVRRGCRIVVVTSGGEAARQAEDLGLGRVLLPGGLQPRAAVGLLTLGALGAVEAAGLLPSIRADLGECVHVLDVLVDQLAPGVPTTINLAKQVAEAVGEAVPVVWGAEGLGAVAAMRWKTQMNENAKVPAFASSLPELDHNEVVGWSQDRGHGYLVVALRHDGEHPDVAARFELSARIAEDAGARTLEVRARGRSALARFFSLVLVGDFTTTYLGIARGADPTPVEAIARLKSALARP
ncbi:MAG TPA: bifunctional phosphoglucose/phosphomannose isomerase [Actinomycetota bacterium]|nr:bifunctional phosphoglucose/phosphomannose isomerase [Actinomycetota bacterium]